VATPVVQTTAVWHDFGMTGNTLLRFYCDMIFDIGDMNYGIKRN
jgi:hypothetical protein